jgi:hypothetical protein
MSAVAGWGGAGCGVAGGGRAGIWQLARLSSGVELSGRRGRGRVRVRAANVEAQPPGTVELELRSGQFHVVKRGEWLPCRDEG